MTTRRSLRKLLRDYAKAKLGKRLNRPVRIAFPRYRDGRTFADNHIGPHSNWTYDWSDRAYHVQIRNAERKARRKGHELDRKLKQNRNVSIR